MASTKRSLAAWLSSAALSLGVSAAASAADHPLDPLDEGEIIAAAQLLLDGGAALPGAIFQSVELQEPTKDLVLAFHAGDPIPRAATVFFRQNERSYRSVVDLIAGSYSTPVR